jgi:hypothetical protein
MNTSIGYETVLAIAQAIAHCDFRVMVSRYVTSDGSPWIITVGESLWRRHLVVESAPVDQSGSHATLAVLSQDESGKFGYDIRANNIVERIELSELIAESYVGVKKALYPRKVEVKVTFAQLESMFAGKRLRITDSEPSVLGDEFVEGVCIWVHQSDSEHFSVHMEMDKAYMGQKKCTTLFTPEVVTATSIEGPLHAEKGGRRKIEVIG